MPDMFGGIIVMFINFGITSVLSVKINTNRRIAQKLASTMSLQADLDTMMVESINENRVFLKQCMKRVVRDMTALEDYIPAKTATFTGR